MKTARCGIRGDRGAHEAGDNSLRSLRLEGRRHPFSPPSRFARGRLGRRVGFRQFSPPGGRTFPGDLRLTGVALRETIISASNTQVSCSVGSPDSVMRRFPSSTNFNSRPSRLGFSSTSFGACDGLYFVRRVEDDLEIMRLRTRVGRLELRPVLRRDYDSGSVCRQALASVRGRRVGRKRHAFQSDFIIRRRKTQSDSPIYRPPPGKSAGLDRAASP